MRRPIAAGCLIAVALCVTASVLRGEPHPAEPPSLRPRVSVVLTTGERLQGTLERFDDGEYWLQTDGKRKTFQERDAKSIEFHAPPATADTHPELADLIRRFLRVNPAGRAADNADISLRTELAGHGQVIVKPLLAAYAKHQGDYQQTGLALKELGPAAFPLLVEEFRQESQGKYGHPVWYALRESGVHHTSYVQTLLTDEDPRIRRLAMDVFYSWAISSGVALPASLTPALIKILDDPDDNVSDQAPLVLKSIGFRSPLVLPALLKTLTDDRYGSVRGSSVLALGGLGLDLKANDPDLATIVTALATTLVDDPSDNVRSYAAMYLGYICPKASAALPVLERATDDKKPYVRKCAEEALAKIRGGQQRE